jgi:hypothetical protein
MGHPGVRVPSLTNTAKLPSSSLCTIAYMLQSTKYRPHHTLRPPMPHVYRLEDRGDIYTRCPTLFTPAVAVSKISFLAMTPSVSRQCNRRAYTLCFVDICAPRNTGVFHTWLKNNDRLATLPIRDGERNGDTPRRRGKHSLLENDCSKHPPPPSPSPSMGHIPETLEFEFSCLAMAWASVGCMPWVHGLVGLAGRVVGPTQRLGSRATTGPGRVSGVVPRWRRGTLGRPGRKDEGQERWP